MSPPTRPDPAPTTVLSLTGVRGIAAVWVVLFHIQSYAGELGMPWLKGTPVLRDGWAGVDLFFVLSGFVLALVHDRDFARLSWAATGRFLALRFFRVYPLATVVLGLIVIGTALSPGFVRVYSHLSEPPNLTPVAFVRTLLLATRWWAPVDGDWNQPVWSLSVELLGYGVFPLLALVAGKMRNRLLLAGLAVCCLLFPTAVALGHGKWFNDDIFWGAPVRMAGGFTAGVVLCRLHRLVPIGWRTAQGAIADFGAAGLLACLLLPNAEGLATVCFGAIVFGLASGEGLLNRVLSAPVSVWLGQVSFPLYLVHVMALMGLRYACVIVYHPPDAVRIVAVVAYLSFCFGLAYALHLGVERPMHRLARQWLGRSASPQRPKTERREAGCPAPEEGVAIARR